MVGCFPDVEGVEGGVEVDFWGREVVAGAGRGVGETGGGEGGGEGGGVVL